MHFLNAATADISGDICITAELFAQVQKLVCTEAVVFVYLPPEHVEYGFAFLLWSNCIFPVICVSEASAGPAKNRDVNFFEGFDDVISDAACVGNGTIGADPDTVIKTSAEMLCEMTINIETVA
jgi:hypothetical protein